MKALLLFSLILSAGYLIITRYKPLSIEKPVAIKEVAPVATPPPLVELTESHYIGLGLPSLTEAWDAEAITRIKRALLHIRSNTPADLPNAGTNYGKAFFGKLRHTVQRFHFLPGDKKHAFYNAFLGLRPIYSTTENTYVRYDREVALLVGLQFELLAGVTEDQHFVAHRSLNKNRISRDLDGNTIVVRGIAIYLEGGTHMLERDVRSLLNVLADPATLRPEARILGLSYVSSHLPAIARHIKASGVIHTLKQHRANEDNAEVKAYYDTIIARLN